jgi:uncharacterized protein YjbJ (UPF0337 family)
VTASADKLSVLRIFSKESHMNMNWDQIKGDWKQLRTKLKEKWGKLTDEDLVAIAGKRDKLISILAQRYEFKKERAELELDHFIHRLSS